MSNSTKSHALHNVRIYKSRELVFVAALVAIEVLLAVFLFFSFSPSSVLAGVGENVTVITALQIGNVFPEILNVSINGGNSSVDLIANSTRIVSVYVTARDYNGEADIRNISVRLFDGAASTFNAADDNNNHYTNNSCAITTGYGDAFEVNATCTFAVQYYANNASWTATARANDTYGATDMRNNTITVNSLLSLGLPGTLDYGEVNATFVSLERVANVTNFGNVYVNISLRGYAVTEGDNLSMNCTLGSVKNISIVYEKYNLTQSNDTTPLSLAQFEALYTNLTSTATVKQFNLVQRTDDVTHNAINATYWRMYVPTGVAGSCQGNIVFGAIRTSGT